MRMKRRVLLTGCCLLVAALGLQPALGQEQPQKPTEESQTTEDIRLTRMQINNERQALVTKGMDLTPSEMQHFWPLYRQYRSEAMKVGDRIVALITTYADNYQNMTDKVADKLLTEFVSIEQERAVVSPNGIAWGCSCIRNGTKRSHRPSSARPASSAGPGNVS